MMSKEQVVRMLEQITALDAGALEALAQGVTEFRDDYTPHFVQDAWRSDWYDFGREIAHRATFYEFDLDAPEFPTPQMLAEILEDSADEDGQWNGAEVCDRLVEIVENHDGWQSCVDHGLYPKHYRHCRRCIDDAIRLLVAAGYKVSKEQS